MKTVFVWWLAVNAALFVWLIIRSWWEDRRIAWKERAIVAEAERILQEHTQ